MKRHLALLVLVMLAVPLVVWAESIIWGAGLEASPTDSDLAANIDNFIRETRTAVRERADTEHAWDDSGGDTTQTGRHREGSARAFFDNAEPTTIAVADSDGSNALGASDDGRLWVDSNAGNALHVWDGVALDFERVAVAVPVNAIILWAETTGDEDCNGAMLAGECPCGFAKATAFNNLLARGADTLAANGDIPDGPGITCTQAAPGVGCGAGVAAEYDDTLDTAELPAHTHAIAGLEHEEYNSGGQDSTVFEATDSGVADPDEATAATGGATTHYHPFLTVLFCKAL